MSEEQQNDPPQLDDSQQNQGDRVQLNVAPDSNTTTSQIPTGGNNYNPKMVKFTLYLSSIIFIAANCYYISSGSQGFSDAFKFQQAVSTIFPILCGSNFLIQLILYFRDDIHHVGCISFIIILYYICGELVISCLTIYILGHKNRIIAYVLIFNMAWKNYYYIRERLLPQPKVYNPQLRRFESIPKPRFAGSPYVLIFLEVIALFYFEPMTIVGVRRDIFAFGVVAQIFMKMHWAYLQRIHEEGKIHSLLGYIYFIAEASIITVIYSVHESTALFVLMMLYSWVRNTTILENFYSFRGSYRFTQMFDFIQRLFWLSIKEMILAFFTFLSGALCIVFGFNIHDFAYVDYIFILFIAIEVIMLLALRFYPSLKKNQTSRLICYFIYMVISTVPVCYFFIVLQYAPTIALMLCAVMTWKSVFVIREHFNTVYINAIENSDDGIDKSFVRKNIFVIVIVMVLLVLDLQFQTEIKHYVTNFDQQKLKYMLSALAGILFVLFELESIPIFVRIFPLNAILGILYIASQFYVLHCLSSFLIVLSKLNVVMRILFVLGFLLKDLSFHVANVKIEERVYQRVDSEGGGRGENQGFDGVETLD